MTSSNHSDQAVTVDLSDGRAGIIVGYVDAGPGLPATGTRVAALLDGAIPADPTFVLVSVRWPTHTTIVNIHTLKTDTHDAADTTTWYLAALDATPTGYAIAPGHTTTELTAGVPDLPGITAARTVAVRERAC
ncbi:hypothetical protein [Gordonia tangerina]|uniref:Uncharacterized protein n=1 Tax=Gordonia tangerina TaxID=2911060 RepID=A0ABS9DN50_9ACTN|nr:hypothetical protein [Gordonia tangerina]MCF3940628.1 hypothetical protein [Gordonia tangerina]